MVTEAIRSGGLEIGELARASGVTVRTIRYYIQQGLLPSAEFSGPSTRYSPGHLVRLRLVRSLQARNVPLVEIRSRIGGLDDDEAQTLLETLEGPGATAARVEAGGRAEAGPLPVASSRWAVAMPRAAAASLTAPGPVSGDSAVDYVRRVLAEFGPEVASPSAARPAAQTRTAWERIALAPDVELHLRPSDDVRRRARLERLIEAAREILEADE